MSRNSLEAATIAIASWTRRTTCTGLAALLACASAPPVSATPPTVPVESSDNESRPANSDELSAPVWYAWPDRDEASLGACTLFIREVGTGPPLVVVHGGFGAEHSYLLPAFEALAASHRLVFYDQRGSLRSKCPIESISLDKHVADLEYLREEIGLERVVILAHSMGTLVASAYLAQHPDRVGAMVLLAAPPLKDQQTEPELEKLLAAQTERVNRRAEIEVKAEWARAGLDEDDGSDRTVSDRWRIQFAGANLYHVDRWRELEGGQAFYDAEAGQAAYRSLPDGFDFSEALRRHPHPITLIHGDHDFADPGGGFNRAVLAGSEVDFVLLEEAGHNAWLDQPARFEAEVAKAVSR